MYFTDTIDPAVLELSRKRSQNIRRNFKKIVGATINKQQPDAFFVSHTCSLYQRTVGRPRGSGDQLIVNFQTNVSPVHVSRDEPVLSSSVLIVGSLSVNAQIPRSPACGEALRANVQVFPQMPAAWRAPSGTRPWLRSALETAYVEIARAPEHPQH